MKANVINEKALSFLMQQNWNDAQRLFFENAKKNPSHETYNNLGNFLIDEGLLCKNGRYRNAQKLGLKYLLKAAEIKDSQVNLCALAKAYDYELRTAVGVQREKLLEQSGNCLKKALEIKYSNEIQYNYLRILYLMGAKDETILEKTRILVRNYVCEESISLYFELLSEHLLIDEGLLCIECYGEYLTEIDLLMFFSKTGLYEKGYSLCEIVRQQFSLDKYIISAIVECCIKTKHFEEAKKHIESIEIIKDDIRCNRNEMWSENIWNSMLKSDDKRKSLIADYSSIPPFVKSCCYYGCPIHRTNW